MKEENKTISWYFEGEKGEFALNNPHKTSGLYFPLANESGMMSSITPLLGGDIKTSQNTFLMAPVSVGDLHSSNSSRNFWLNIDDNLIWSATGNSLKQKLSASEKDSDESVKMEAGFLWQKITRENRAIGVRSEITNFVPVNDDKVELMRITIKNIRTEEMRITPTVAIPIYGRSADNIRDHRHVTSLLHKISTNKYGVIVKPTLSFDERGHKPNSIYYTVQAVEENGGAPLGFFPVEEDFIGEGGSLDWPEAVLKNSTNYCEKDNNIDGYEAIGAIKFESITLKPGETKSYIVILGINHNSASIEQYIDSYGNISRFEKELEKNKEYWEIKLSSVSFNSSDKNFDLWMKWVELQPMMRRIYGCSFLPHHDYGRGGRGWRDLWQDCLALLLLEPKQVRGLLLNNYGGVRFDGSNATIIGAKSGEFIADRNNIPRTWMDHGAWPYFTTRLYVDLSGDLEFLLEEQVYFKDKQCSRSRETDAKWSSAYGSNQKDEEGRLYKGSIFEHILLEQVTAFYNVGEHNNIKLEGADWNDGFDMADEKGESVTFTAFYGSNLMDLSKLLISIKEKLGIEEIEVAKEIMILIDSISGKIDYNSVTEKNNLLNNYFKLCIHNISGEKIKIDIRELSKDLERKATWIINHIRKNEWIENSEGFQWFNGYYDNAGKALEGDFPSGVRMTLTGQVFPIMGGVADEEQVKKIIAATNKYLKETKIGGLRLNTNFNEVKLNMGRCFGFAFGHKENGAMFSHMTVMYINALYRRGFVKEGYEILNDIYKHCSDFEKSRIFPGIPEYINERGRGMYQYLTGAASWLLLTVLNEVYGVKGLLGDLMLEPKLVSAQFDNTQVASVFTVFRDKKLNIVYKNEKKFEYGEYKINSATLDGEVLELKLVNNSLIIDKEVVDKLEINIKHQLVVELN
ncbi:MAG: cellobiose phosphorylase [Clostridiaceae bacterium]|nr:cellobiose phosphorylase [Clostridiaceae bacterium]